MIQNSTHMTFLGAGPCGLGAACHLDRLGYPNWQLFELGNQVGGLSSYLVESAGFTWDIGGHVLFSHYPQFDQIVEQALDGQYYQHQRESWVRVQNTWVLYPFQNNIHYLSQDACTQCIDGLKHLCEKTEGNWADLFLCHLPKFTEFLSEIYVDRFRNLR